VYCAVDDFTANHSASSYKKVQPELARAKL
jgi:hypothetical protein